MSLRAISLRFSPLAIMSAIGSMPLLARAHEVYVLPTREINAALQAPPLQVFSIIWSEERRFFFWMFLVAAIIVFVFFVSISKRMETRFDPGLDRLKLYAPFVGRITLGLSMLASAHYGAIFGPELPFTNFLAPEYISSFRIFMFITGTLILLGLWTRTAALLLMLTYGALIFKYHLYMLTYLNYFGEMVIAFILGAQLFAIDKILPWRLTTFTLLFADISEWFEDHAFFFLRISFGVSLIYASIYAKFLHAQLALDVVTRYNLTHYFHFDPPFLVLGAFAIEILLGLFFIFGIELRFTAIFLIGFLTLSLIYFGEAVWPHIILAGTAIVIFFRGYGKYTLEWQFLHRLFGKNVGEPVL